jgi:hypothetical protein
MSYDKTCAYSKQLITENQEAYLIFLAADSFAYKQEKKGFFLEPDYVYPWDHFKIIGFPIKVINRGRNHFKYIDEKAANFIKEKINKATMQEQSLDEICEKIFDAKLEGERGLRKFGISYMLISKASFEHITSKNKRIGFMDNLFLSEDDRVREEMITYEQSLKEKSDYFDLVLNPKEEGLFEVEKEDVEYLLEKQEDSEELDSEYKTSKETAIKNAILIRYKKTPISQTPFTLINFALELLKDETLKETFTKGLANNIWISEAFEDLRISFSPKMNSINYSFDSELVFFYKEMADLIQKSNKNKEIAYDIKNGKIIIEEEDFFEKISKLSAKLKKEFKDYYSTLENKEIDLKKLKESNEMLHTMLFDMDLLPQVFIDKKLHIK